MDFRQLMGGMASGLGRSMMDKEFGHAYNAGQEGFTDPLQGEHVTDKYTQHLDEPGMLEDTQRSAQLHADLTRARGPKRSDQRMGRPTFGGQPQGGH